VAWGFRERNGDRACPAAAATILRVGDDTPKGQATLPQMAV
jgi:hypothetical protein